MGGDGDERGLVARPCEELSADRKSGVACEDEIEPIEGRVDVRTPCRGTRLPSIEPVDGQLITAEELADLGMASAPRYGRSRRRVTCGFRGRVGEI